MRSDPAAHKLDFAVFVAILALDPFATQGPGCAKTPNPQRAVRISHI